MPGTTIEQVNFRDYMQALWRRRWLIVIVTLVAVVGALAVSAVLPKRYEATASLLLTPNLPSASLQAKNPVYTATIIDVPTDIQILQSNTVSSIANKATGKNLPSVTGKQVGTTDVVQVTVDNGDPKLASQAANAYANAYITLQHRQIAGALQQDQSQLNQRLASVQQAVTSVSAEIATAGPNASAGVQAELAAVQAALQGQEGTLQDAIAEYQSYLADQPVEGGELITPATPPTHKSSPKTTEYVVLALLIGLVVGLALAMILEALGRPPASTEVPVDDQPRGGTTANGGGQTMASPPTHTPSHI